MLKNLHIPKNGCTFVAVNALSVKHSAYMQGKYTFYMQEQASFSLSHDSRHLPYSHRRSLFADYKGRGIYLITLCVEGRKALLGSLHGATAEQACVIPSPLGRSVIELLLGIPAYQQRKAEEKRLASGMDIKREIQILAYQLMPDHLHVILFVRQEMDISIGEVLRGFMIMCTKACYTLGIYAETSTGKQPLWEKGYHDRRLSGKGQLQAMIDYVHDNPRRLFLKHQNAGLFTIKHAISKAGYNFDAMGNMQLLNKPLYAVHVRSRFSPDERKAYMNTCILEARKGKILVGAFISDYEKQVKTVALHEGFSIIQLSPLPFSAYYKPSGELFDLCAAGRLLLLYPISLSASPESVKPSASPESVSPSAYMPRAQQNPYWQTQRRISRAECVALNAIAEGLASTSSNTK